MALVGISIDDVEAARQMAAAVGADYPLLADPTHHVADAYGVFNLLGDGVATPSVFVVKPDRTIHWSHIGRSISDRPSTTDILTRIR